MELSCLDRIEPKGELRMTTYLGTAAVSTPGIEGDTSIGGVPGVKGSSSVSNSYAVVGYNTSTSGSGGAGVYGNSSNSAVAGVYGYNSGGSGVQGNTSTGYGVYGQSSSNGQGGHFTNSGNGIGAYGYAATTGVGLEGQNDGTGYGVRGSHNATSGTGYGTYGESSSNSGYGLYGVNFANGGIAVYATVGTGGYGVYATATSGIGVYATSASSTNQALYATNSGGGPAAYFGGSVQVTGALSKGSGTFLIDHPLDPTNKDLLHSFVESPEMKNIYDGRGVADGQGEMIVEMPEYFDALNSDFRYQLTALGGPAPELHVKTELTERRFVIAGAKPGQKICWQVTGVRKDAFALAHPVEVEREKKPSEKGKYRYPVEHGQPMSMGIDFDPRIAKQIEKAMSSSVKETH
jgi:hypothetical protein